MRNKKTKHMLVIIVVCGLVIATLLGFVYFGKPMEEEYSDVFVGVDAAYDSPEEIKTLVDAISPYTNVFVIGNTGITFNETKLTDLCRYIYGKGLHFILYADDRDPPSRPSGEWIVNAKA